MMYRNLPYTVSPYSDKKFSTTVEKIHGCKPMSFQEIKNEFNKALDDEIKTLQKKGGQQIYVNDGIFLGIRGSQYIYSFSADRDILLPDDTPIIVIHEKKQLPAILVSSEDSDIIVALPQKLGDKIIRATLRIDPWFLYKKLQDRLEEVSKLNGCNRNLACILLNTVPEAIPLKVIDSQLILNGIAKCVEQPINYNQYQKQAIDAVLTRQVSFVWGPPGTGKTSTLGLTVASLVASGESVLILAHSNTAIDTAIKSAAKYLESTSYYQNGLVLRFGFPSKELVKAYPNLDVFKIVGQDYPELTSQIKELRQQKRQLIKESRNSNLSSTRKNELKSQIGIVKTQIHPLLEEYRQKGAELIKKAMVVGCTVSKATIADELYTRRFDAVIIDEASMAYIPHCTFAATLAKKRIAIFGDFRQLDPISEATTDIAQKWLQRDIFDEAGIITSVNRNQVDPRLVLLKIQYRMHPDISKIPNNLFYNGQLQDAPSVINQSVSTSPLTFWDTSNIGASCFNEVESGSRFNIISALIALSAAYSSVQKSSSTIGIITPYNAQSRLLQKLLQDLQIQDKVKCATVHRFQGDEQNLIIFDSVEGESQANIGKLLKGGILSTAGRLANVAVSRAQSQFISIVNYRYVQRKLDSLSIFRKFIDRIYESSNVEALDWNTNLLINLPGITYFSGRDDAQTQLKIDFHQSAEEIAIYWSTHLSKNNFLSTTLRQCSNRGIRFFLTGLGQEALTQGLRNTKTWNNRCNYHEGYISIDRKVLWIYLNPALASSPILRIDLPQTVKLITSFLRLVPVRDPGSIESQFQQGKNPLGDCPTCAAPMWLNQGSYGPYISCSRNVNHVKRQVSTQDATLWARFMKSSCSVCQQQLEGAKSSYGGVYLRCTKQGCKSSKSIKDLI